MRVIRSKFPPCPPQYIFIWIWAFSTIGNLKKINVFDLLARYWIWSNCWKLHWIFFSDWVGHLDIYITFRDIQILKQLSPLPHNFLATFAGGGWGIEAPSSWTIWLVNLMKHISKKMVCNLFKKNQIWKITEALVCF